MTPVLPQPLAGLMKADAYPHPVGRIELVQTHVSWVLLTGSYAYKIKRPVCFPFIDLRSMERRRDLCKQELLLNRRFAPGLYVEVCPVTLQAGRARIGGGGEIIEHAVKMKQFAREDELYRLLDDGRIAPGELRDFGVALGRIHAGLPVAGPGDVWGEPERTSDVLLANLRESADALAGLHQREAVADLESEMRARLNAARPLMSARKAAGMVRECHGDLHSSNIVRVDGHLVAFDCLEFEPSFRWIDVAEEIAFLFADLRAGGRMAHAYEFLSGYLEETGDYQACRLLPLYAAHRMLVRAKVVALAAAEAGDGAERARLSERSIRHLQQARLELTSRRPLLVLMSGLSGSGKTWLARQLAPRLEAVHLRSDLERKRMAGLPPQSRSGSVIGAGLYAPQVSAQVYERLASSAADILAGGLDVVVDATFLRRAERERFARLAEELAVPALLVLCEAPPAVLRERIERREQEGVDLSEAGLDVLRWQQERIEMPDHEEGLPVIRADTTRTAIVESVLARIQQAGGIGPLQEFL